jgi:radical SAM superfamily enzyme YgiQ (UPF0313 family)
VRFMILHCTPPYRQDIPNPALGYLKGFLQAQGISVRNVYWNLVLAKTILKVHRGAEKHTKETGLSSLSGITLFLCRHLFTDKEADTPLELIFRSIFTRQEISQIVSSFKSDIEDYIQMNRIDQEPVHGFTLKTYQWPVDVYLVNRLKELNPDTTIIIGGLTTQEQARTFLNLIPRADYAIWGEGEYPLYYLARALEEGGPVTGVPNVMSRDGSTAAAVPVDSPLLDSYPFADHSDYFKSLNLAPSGGSVLIPIWGSRGCPWNKCRFCVLNEEYLYRVRSPENIVQEIEYQSRKHGIDSFIFVDTELPGNMKRFKALLKLLLQSSAKRKKPYHFHAEVSPVFIDAETARDMSQASFSSVQIGFEGMTDTLLEKMHKRHRFAHNIQALKAGTQYNLRIGGLNIIRGIPTETVDDVKESCSSVQYVRFFLDTFSLSPSVLSLFKGSPFYDDMSPEERQNWNENPFYAELVPLDLGIAEDRFEFFGFCRESVPHYHNWDIFERVLTSYQSQRRTYTWIEYEDGSFLEERGVQTYRYTLDRDETDVLLFCDTIRSFNDLKKEFSHLGEDELRTIVENLKDAAMLYCDVGLNTLISVIDASARMVAYNQ